MSQDPPSKGILGVDGNNSLPLVYGFLDQAKRLEDDVRRLLSGVAAVVAEAVLIPQDARQLLS